jgi:TonB family protein
MIAFINDWADAWLNVFGYAVVQNTVFLIVIFLLLSVLKNVDAKYKYAIGCIGLAKCLIPPFLPLPALHALRPAPGLPAASTSVGPMEIIPVNFVEMPTAQAFLFIAWLMVALAFLLVPLGATLVLKVKLKRSGSDVLNETDPQNERHGVKLFHSDLLHIPLSLGFLPDSIYLPRLWRNLPQECRRVMLQHELAHIQRRDGLVRFFQIVVQAIYFFNPFVWLLNAKINEYREMACDDEAVARTNISPMVYSKYLVKIAENVVQRNLGYSSVSALIKQKNKLLKRVHYQMREVTMHSVSKTKVAILITGLLLLIVPLSWTSSRMSPADDQVVVSTDSVQKEPVKKDDDLFRRFFPWPEKGLEEIKKNLVYPDAARKAGLEGEVTVKVEVNERGELKDVSIVESTFENGKDMGCHQAAIDAVRSVKWQQASLAGKGVSGGYGYNIPIKFALDSSPPQQKTEPPPPLPVGKIYGSVKDKESGEPLPGVNVVIVGTRLGAATDMEGNYFIVNVPPGLYKVQMSFIGYKSVIMDNVKVTVNQSSKIDAALEVGIIEASPVIVYPNTTEGGGERNADKVEPGVTVVAVDKIDTVKGTEEKEFKEFDTPPMPVGGFEAIQQKLVYPESAKEKGIEGRVVIRVHIDKNGRPTQSQIIASSGNEDCDKVAVKAVTLVQWKPATLDGNPVDASVGIPVMFKLKGEQASEEAPIFVPYDEPPAPVGGFKALQKVLVYPEMAQKSGVEGRVLLKIFVSAKGEVTDTQVIKSLGNNGCDEAAINAVKAVKWIPAKQREKPVGVWVSIPVVFQLNKEK